jgi:hypothetical protein
MGFVRVRLGLLACCVIASAVVAGPLPAATTSDKSVRAHSIAATREYNKVLRRIAAANAAMRADWVSGAGRLLGVAADAEATFTTRKELLALQTPTTAKGRSGKKVMLRALTALIEFAKYESRYAEAAINDNSKASVAAVFRARTQQRIALSLMKSGQRLLGF